MKKITSRYGVNLIKLRNKIKDDKMGEDVACTGREDYFSWKNLKASY
jgi:hypothetical protein